MAQKHAYIPSGMHRATYVHVDLCARVRAYACVSRVHVYTRAHIEARLPARLREREEERTCTMHECVYVHTGPSWIYSRRNFATRADERGMREEGRKEFRSEMRESTDVARRPRGLPKGLSRDLAGLPRGKLTV